MSDALLHGRPAGIADDETVIEEVDTLLMYGPLAWNVGVVLTDRRLVARPTSALERLAGASGVEFALSDVTKVVWSGLQRQVTFELESGRRVRLTGGGARVLHARVSALRSADQGSSRAVVAQAARFLPGERVLVSGAVDAVVQDPLWASGQVQLTTLRLRFEPSRGVQSLLVSSRPVELPLSELAGLRVTRGGSAVALLRVVQRPGDGGPMVETAVELVRGVVPGLGATLRAMGLPELARDTVPTTPPILEPPVLSGVGRMGEGALARSGHVAIGRGGIAFASADFVSTVAGTSVECIDLAQVLRIDQDKAKPKLLRIQARGQDAWRVVELDKAAVGLEHLASLLAQVPARSALPLDRRNRLEQSDLADLVRMHGAVLPPNRRHEPTLGVSAVRRTRAGRCVRGWLLVLNVGVLFLPFDGRAEDRRFFEGALIDRVRSGVDGPQVRIVVERRAEEFAVVGGGRPAAELWRALWSQLPDATALTGRFPYLDVLVGQIRCVRVQHNRVELLSRRMVTTSLERDGIGLSVGLEAPELLAPGLDVEVEMGDEKTVYTFRTHVARVEVREDDLFLVLGLSRDVQKRKNNRRAFRVAIEADLSIDRVPRHGAKAVGSPWTARLENVSWTGVAVSFARARALGTLLEAVIPLGDATRTYRFEVIHTQKRAGDEGILHGCRFLDLTAGDQDHIQSAVIRQQMREVAARELKNELAGLPGVSV